MSDTPMRVGVYIDGFNLYFGGRGLMGGRGKPGWRWLDLRQLATNWSPVPVPGPLPK